MAAWVPFTELRDVTHRRTLEHADSIHDSLPQPVFVTATAGARVLDQQISVADEEQMVRECTHWVGAGAAPSCGAPCAPTIRRCPERNCDAQTQGPDRCCRERNSNGVNGRLDGCRPRGDSVESHASLSLAGPASLAVSGRHSFRRSACARDRMEKIEIQPGRDGGPHLSRDAGLLRSRSGRRRRPATTPRVRSPTWRASGVQTPAAGKDGHSQVKIAAVARP